MASNIADWVNGVLYTLQEEKKENKEISSSKI